MADELRGDMLSGAGKEGLGEVTGGRGGYGSGFGDVADAILLPPPKLTSQPRCRSY